MIIKNIETSFFGTIEIIFYYKKEKQIIIL